MVQETYLVGGLEHDFLFYVPIQLGMSSSQLTYIFQRGRLKPPTNLLFILGTERNGTSEIWQRSRHIGSEIMAWPLSTMLEG
jgi:hypothetical protein